MNIKRLFCALLLLWTISAAAEEPLCRQFIYGKSEMGRELVCYAVGDESAEKSLLIIFGVHGFEDDYPHDGQVLRLIGEAVIAHYAAVPDSLAAYCLYIVPAANPDGLLDGKTQNGFGRCNANGLDINRDFPVNWKKRTDDRNKTGDEPFSTAEARAIRSLVEEQEPTWAIDVHGWINASYGYGRMARTFAKPFRFIVKQPVSGGMLCTWLSTVTQEAIMLELPYSPNEGRYVLENSARLIEGIDAWLASNREGVK